ncbi:hypothetical protein LZ30DRAFT_704872 [Colletotrichum cereale]|nr:hypothetical protein LZ30DRAFT_704872 [Colletotrichum cereale]
MRLTQSARSCTRRMLSSLPGEAAVSLCGLALWPALNQRGRAAAEFLWGGGGRKGRCQGGNRRGPRKKEEEEKKEQGRRDRIGLHGGWIFLGNRSSDVEKHVDKRRRPPRAKEEGGADIHNPSLIPTAIIRARRSLLSAFAAASPPFPHANASVHATFLLPVTMFLFFLPPP